MINHHSQIISIKYLCPGDVYTFNSSVNYFYMIISVVPDDCTSDFCNLTELSNNGTVHWKRLHCDSLVVRLDDAMSLSQ